MDHLEQKFQSLIYEDHHVFIGEQKLIPNKQYVCLLKFPNGKIVEHIFYYHGKSFYTYFNINGMSFMVERPSVNVILLHTSRV